MFFRKNDKIEQELISQSNVREEQQEVFQEQQKQVSIQKEDNTLEVAIRLAPSIHKLLPLDCMLAISDTEKYLYYAPGTQIKLPNDIVGQPLQQDALYQAVNTGRTVDMVLSDEVFGVPFQAIGIPVKNVYEQTIGAIGVAISLAKRQTITEIAKIVSGLSQQNSATVQELASSAEQLTKFQESLQVLGQNIMEEVNKTDKILHFINEVASTSNLLGLNASIEAARAGEQGRGFTVVAEEIRKMSVSSAQGVKEIREILSNIKGEITTIVERITETSAISQQQAAATQEISASMEELSSSSEELENIAETVVG